MPETVEQQAFPAGKAAPVRLVARAPFGRGTEPVPRQSRTRYQPEANLRSGHSRQFDDVRVTSALPLIADLREKGSAGEKCP